MYSCQERKHVRKGIPVMCGLVWGVGVVVDSHGVHLGTLYIPDEISVIFVFCAYGVVMPFLSCENFGG